MKALVIIEHDNQQVMPCSLSAISAAARLGEVNALVAGDDCRVVAQHVAGLSGVSNVIYCQSPIYGNGLAEPLALLVVRESPAYDSIVAAASCFGKNLMPRVAALMDVSQVSEVVEIISTDTFKRFVYSGSVVATVRSSDPVKVLTVRPTAFDMATTTGQHATIYSVSAAADPAVSRQVSSRHNQSGERDLTTARVVISGGAGLGAAENFQLLESLAQQLGGVVGASRAAIDAGFVAHELQIGQTGKVIAPDLYIAVGISGALQHNTGVMDSKVIVAINKDPEAAIFNIADYGVVGDLFEIIPQLIGMLSTKQVGSV